MARAIGVSESTLKRWADSGAVGTTRTPGGHRRIAFAEAVALARRSGVPLRDAGVLGLPDIRPEESIPGGAAAAERFHDLLLADEAEEARRFLVSLYVAGWSVAAICDGPVASALARIGELWRHDEAGIFLEHRATETSLQALRQLRGLVAGPAAGAPLALGAAPAGDPYVIPSQMAALVAADAGFEDRNLGADAPVSAIRAAAARHRPRLVWVAMSVAPKDPRATLEELAELGREVEAHGGVLVVGGRASSALGAATGAPVHTLGTMAELAALARGLLVRPAVRRGAAR